jgi:hypothetical protein
MSLNPFLLLIIWADDPESAMHVSSSTTSDLKSIYINPLHLSIMAVSFFLSFGIPVVSVVILLTSMVNC